jgi:hypothetical protein
VTVRVFAGDFGSWRLERGETMEKTEMKVPVDKLNSNRYIQQALFYNRAAEVCLGKAIDRMPICYLCGMAIELALKGYLRGCGWSIQNKAIKNIKYGIGHDIKKALELAKENGLDNHINLSVQQTLVFENLADYYQNRDFEYPQKFYMEIYEADDVVELSSAIVNGLEPFCHEKASLHSGTAEAYKG